jgi:hypothetical protein
LSWASAAGGGASITVSDTPPSAPSVGALWWDSVGGQLYVWYADPNTSQWVPASNSASLPPPASTTVLGSVKVDGTSIKAAADGTISTVLVPMGDNRLINGDMRVDQRNNGASSTASNVYTLDRWQYQASQASKLTWGRTTGTPPAGFPYYWGSQSSSAYALVAADYFFLSQIIEADMISDFQWGGANAQPVTLSFWVYSSLTGTFTGAIRGASTRSYPFTYSIPIANTWTRIVVVIPGDTGGTWVLSGNAMGAQLVFDLGSGSTNRGPANAWAASGYYLGATGAVSIVATNGAFFNVTGVKLEVGSIATPFNRQSLAKSMADCQRYYQTGYFGLQGNAAATSTTVGYEQTLAVVMRATPTTIVASETSNSAMAARQITPDSPSHIRPNGAAANVFSWTGTFTASAEL